MVGDKLLASSSLQYSYGVLNLEYQGNKEKRNPSMISCKSLHPAIQCAENIALCSAGEIHFALGGDDDAEEALQAVQESSRPFRRSATQGKWD
jgi:hypothetical protein